MVLAGLGTDPPQATRQYLVGLAGGADATLNTGFDAGAGCWVSSFPGELMSIIFDPSSPSAGLILTALKSRQRVRSDIRCRVFSWLSPMPHPALIMN